MREIPDDAVRLSEPIRYRDRATGDLFLVEAVQENKSHWPHEETMIWGSRELVYVDQANWVEHRTMSKAWRFRKSNFHAKFIQEKYYHGPPE